MLVTTVKFKNRLAWRAHPGKSLGMTRTAAVARAAENIKTIEDSISADLWSQVDLVGAHLSSARETGALDLDLLYEACHRIAATAAVVGCDDVGEMAAGGCGVIDAGSDDPEALAFALRLLAGAMARLRSVKSAGGPEARNVLALALARFNREAPSGAQGVREASTWAQEKGAGEGEPRAGALIRLVYASVAHPGVEEGDADADARAAAIVEAAAPRNARLGVSGMLLAHRDWYLQCLEGPADALAEVACAIAFDPRHAALRALVLDRPERRRFPRPPVWAVGPGDRAGDILKAMREGFTPKTLEPDAAWRLVDGIARLAGR